MRCLPVLAALLCCSAATSDEAAAQLYQPPDTLTRDASSAATTIAGIVTDEDGEAIAGASVFAMGAVITAARSDDTGQFRMSLAPGAYILRATRDGYVSAYREVVQVRPDVPLRRNITLMRADTGDAVLASVERQLPSTGTDAGVEPAAPSRPGPTETVWRLRHLPRTVLRERVAAVRDDDTPTADAGRAAATVLAELDGHVDFLTTSAVSATGEPSDAEWPRSVAYVVLGAPVGGHGNWSVRASLAGGDSSAWTFASDYASNRDRAHVVRAGMSYSAQTTTQPGDRGSLVDIDTVRRVGGFHVSDVWAVTKDLEIDSRMQIARYDYLADPNMINGRVGVRQRLWPRLTVVAVGASENLAPGADQFAPPASAGVWLPPDRTFSALRGDLRAQHVISYEFGADTVLTHEGKEGTDVVLRVRRFSERSTRQIATLFGIDQASQTGHYYISSPGDVALDGWLVGLSGMIATHVHATLDYATTVADWHDTEPRSALRRVAGSTVRSGVETLHDVTATFNADVPTTSTRVMVALRVNTGFSRNEVRHAGLAGRFAVEVRQQLPVRPLGQGELNLLFSARTLLHEADTMGGYYDELLTVAPPVRLMCGVQMRF